MKTQLVKEGNFEKTIILSTSQQMFDPPFIVKCQGFII